MVEMCLFTWVILGVGTLWLSSCYPLRKLTSVLLLSVYIPTMSEAWNKLTEQQKAHPASFLITAGNLNHADLTVLLPKLHQHVDFPTRVNNTLWIWCTQPAKCKRLVLLWVWQPHQCHAGTCIQTQDSQPSSLNKKKYVCGHRGRLSSLRTGSIPQTAKRQLPTTTTPTLKSIQELLLHTSTKPQLFGPTRSHGWHERFTVLKSQIQYGMKEAKERYGKKIARHLVTPEILNIFGRAFELQPTANHHQGPVRVISTQPATTTSL